MDELFDNGDDEKCVEYIKNYLPQELKERFSDDQLYYFLDVINDYYVESGVLEAKTRTPLPERIAFALVRLMPSNFCIRSSSNPFSSATLNVIKRGALFPEFLIPFQLLYKDRASTRQ